MNWGSDTAPMTQRKTTHRPDAPKAARLPTRGPSEREGITGVTSAPELMAVDGKMASTPNGGQWPCHTTKTTKGGAQMSMELHTAMSSIVGFMTLAKGAIDARDWTKLTELSAKFNDQIIKTQQAVIDAQGAQSDLVAELGEANQKIRELQAALAEQARHSLEEITVGKFALRVDLTGKDQTNLSLDTNGQAKHYACQSCFATTGKSIILQREESSVYGISLLCPVCKTSL